ncbi:hypothetical protein SKAU_G00155980 [Synaphobranchus kaupii]|uniref:Endonuclease/exonuclease/phosphatase domain-containing protein n=1 Tax=Synaphobranchus kaupii TaxID=118154 RepID=A0A9Q1IYX1_SYNKA|nr:hypothetical protein SKAU_G00155980 [Synaphobranchus kaupii]
MGVVQSVLKDLVLIPVHTKPTDSEKELDELYDVFLTVKKKWKTDNVMILGDFNADGAYVSNKKMKGIRIRSDKNFHWLIGDDVDTTASKGNAHSYDRIVVYGDDMLNAVVPNTAQPFNFQKALRLTEEEALRVSDHYPVEVELKMRVSGGQILKDLVLIPVHTKPTDSEKELDELYDVFLTVKKKWKTDNVMILGDFNADGAYVSNKKMKGIRIRSDKNFHWLIGDDVDTTASKGNAHSYDR